MHRLNVVLTAAAAVTLSAAPLSAQWGIFGRSSDRVPSGHMPSRGMCRVWIDGVPPGHQPRQTDCRTAERQRRYYEDRYGRRARVIYGDRTSGRYDTRNTGVIYSDRNGTNCRYVERVIAGRVIRQRVCDDNGVYGRDDRVYDRNGNVIYRRDGVYRDSRGRIIRRDDRGVWRDSRGRVYDRDRRNDRDSDSDSDSDGRGKYKNKNKGRW
jgi:hypothetical protein